MFIRQRLSVSQTPHVENIRSFDVLVAGIAINLLTSCLLEFFRFSLQYESTSTVSVSEPAHPLNSFGHLSFEVLEPC